MIIPQIEEKCNRKENHMTNYTIDTQTLAEIIAIVQEMSAQSRRDLLLVGQGIVMGEQNRKEKDHAKAATVAG